MPHQRTGIFLENPSPASSYTIFHAYAYSHGICCWLSGVKNGKPSNERSDNYLILDTEAVTLLNLLMEEAVGGKDDFETACAGLLTAFFVLLKREIQVGHYMHPGPKAGNESPVSQSSSFAGQVREYLELNCHKPLKQADVAAHFYMSTSQFTRRMRSETGGTFNELLVSIRIERAKELLQETDWTFTGISSHLSFKSSSYFLALFRQKVGCTPAEYRKRKK
jgi:AraC-like DNA-binding protein